MGAAGHNYRETIDGAERHADWARLEAQGWSRTRIAEHAGVNKSSVTRGIDNLLKAVKVAAADELRASSRERLRLLIERCFDNLAKPHPLIRDGQRYDDLVDVAQVVPLIRELRQLDESLRKLDGLDAPMRHKFDTDESSVDRDIERLVAELAARAQDGAPVPAEN